MVKDEEALKIVARPSSELVNNLHLTWVETETRLRAGNRLVSILLHLFVLLVFKRNNIGLNEPIGFLAALGQGTRTFKHDPIALVVDIAVQLSYALELRDNDTMNAHNIANVDHVRKHTSIVREELHWNECLRLCVLFGKRLVVFSRAIEDGSCLLIQSLVNDSNLTRWLLLDVWDTCIKYDTIDVVWLSGTKRDRVKLRVDVFLLEVFVLLRRSFLHILQ